MEFLTIEAIATLAGCVALVTGLTELCKHYIKSNIDPKWYVLFWSAIFVIARQVFIIQDFTEQGWFMTAINVLICIGISVGIGFETILKPIQKALEQRALNKILDQLKVDIELEEKEKGGE